jgi:anti-anti-sigma factor
MNFTVSKKDKCTILTLQEEKLNSLVSPALKTQFVQLVNDGETNIILNLADVKYADSSGLSSILIGNRLCSEKEGMFILACCSDHVLKLLKISQLDTVLNLIPSLEESIDAVFMNELEKSFDTEENNEE